MVDSLDRGIPDAAAGLAGRIEDGSIVSQLPARNTGFSAGRPEVAKGCEVAGLTVGQTAIGGNELVTIMRKARE